MKILYYSPHPLLNLSDPAGYATHMREIIKAWRAQGHEVHPVIMGGTSPAEPGNGQTSRQIKDLLKKGIPSLVWETTKDLQLRRFDRRAKQQLLAEIEAFDPDLIYERANYLQTSGVEAAQATHIPHYLEVNAPYVEERQHLNGKTWLSQRAEQAEQQQQLTTDQIIVVSSALRDFFSKKWQIPQDKYLITPNAIDPDKIHPDSSRVASLKQSLGLQHQTVFGFVGSMFKWHGVDILITAFAALADQDSHLLIVGDGAIRPELEALAAALAIAGRVTFTGSVPHTDVFNYLALMDITLMSNSNWYGSPIKIFEYGAMGKAIIAPDKVPVQDVMIHEQHGLLVPPKVEAVVTAMQRMLHDTTLREKLADQFQQKVLTEHTWPQMAQMIIKQVHKIS